MIRHIFQWIADNSIPVLCFVTLLVGSLMLCLLRSGTPTTITSHSLGLEQERKIRFYRDQNGKLLTALKVQENRFMEATREADSLAKALKLRPTAIRTIERISVRIDTIIEENVRFLRTPDSVEFHFQDPYLEFRAVGTTSLSFFQLRHKDTLFRTEVHRNPVFGKSYTEILLRAASPYSIIEDGFSFRATAKRPFLTLGPYLGYDPLTRKMSTGISFQVPVIVFYSKK